MNADNISTVPSSEPTGPRTGTTGTASRNTRVTWRSPATAVVALSLIALMTGASGAAGLRSEAARSSTVINAIGAENEYANPLSQIGGKYVKVSSILNNPNTDPHTFESSPSVASEVSAAQLVVQNGVGYDTFMNKIEAASPNAKRKVIVVQTLLGLPDNTPNPHLWYKPSTMPTVARAMAADLAALDPSQATYFQSNLVAFDNSLKPVTAAIASFKAKYAGARAATTEPVADYLLEAMGIDNLTPFGFQADIMNGIDPSPQDISLENRFFTEHKVKVFAYNEQVIDSLTTSIRVTAGKSGIPVVGVYETMPTPGYDFQTWMLAEVHAIEKAVTSKVSTQHL